MSRRKQKTGYRKAVNMKVGIIGMGRIGRALATKATDDSKR